MNLLPAAIAIIFNEKEQVLLVKRKDVDVWVLPGGGIEPAESPENAVRRETEEETGYSISIMRKCAEYLPINRLASETHVFICKVLAGKMELSDETSGIAFFSINSLPTSIFPPHAIWIEEAINNQDIIKRPLIEVTYWALCKYFLCHPIKILKHAWNRFLQ